jgi:hypothetical protein
MFIQNYQIHNVLNVYRKQLSQRISAQSKQTNGPEAGSGPEATSSGSKNQLIMDKVAANVLKKITNVNSNTNADPKGKEAVSMENREPNRHRQEDKFTFNTIVESNQKETRSISFKNSQGLMYQLNHLARRAICRNADSVEETT